MIAATSPRASALLALLLAVLSLIHLSTAASILPMAVSPRQEADDTTSSSSSIPTSSSTSSSTAISQPTPLPAVCQTYSRVANMSTIGLNSTYRAAFLRSAPVGTIAAAALLDTNSPLLPAMKFDRDLNAQCGNLSQVALDGAAANLTRGVVAEFGILPAPGVGVEGLTTPLTVLAIVVVMGGTWMCL